MAEKSLGEELISSVKDALESKESGRIVRPDVDETPDKDVPYSN